MVFRSAGSIEVLEATVHYRRSARPGAPRLLLVHGGAAHGGWWSPAAEHLAKAFDVIVPDLSGHGHSEYREHYSPEIWAEELKALCSIDGYDRAHVAGHSMGGLVAIYFAARFPRWLASLVLVDSNLMPPTSGNKGRRGRAMRPKATYPTIGRALEDFRLRPEPSCAPASVIETVARDNLHRTRGGWQWRVDRATRRRFTNAGLHGHLQRIEVPVGFVYGELSPIVDAQTAEYVQRTVPNGLVGIEVVPNAYHHVPLDAPEACSSAIQRIIQSCNVPHPTDGPGRSE